MPRIRSIALCFTLASASPLTAQSRQWMEDPIGQQRFQPPPTSILPLPPVAADFDGDGRPDVVYATTAGLALYRNVGGGEFVSTSTVAVPLSFLTQQTPSFWRVADYDKDGDMDIVAVTPAAIEIVSNNGAGVLSAGASIAVSGVNSVGAFDIGDLDGDGDCDFVRASANSLRAVFALPGGAFNVVQVRPLTGLIQVQVASLADLDADGDLDLISSNMVGGAFDVYENDGVGGFAQTLVQLPWPGPPFQVLAGDLDGDGELDVIGNHGVGLTAFRNTGGATFAPLGLPQPPGQFPPFLPLPARQFALGDFDADSDVDILTTGFSTSVLLNNGTGGFTWGAGSRWGARGQSYDLLPADFDGDGDLDVSVYEALGPMQGPPRFVINHTRQIHSGGTPTVGGAFQLDVFSGPGYGVPAFTPILASFFVPPTPLSFPGIDGLFDLDPFAVAVPLIVPNVGLNCVNQGDCAVSLPIPNNPILVGVSVYFQSGALPTGASSVPAGFSNTLLLRL